MDLNSGYEFYRNHSSWINHAISTMFLLIAWAIKANRRATDLLCWLFYLPIAALNWAFGLVTFRSIRKSALDPAVQGIVDKIATARITPSNQNELVNGTTRVIGGLVTVEELMRSSPVAVELTFLEWWAVRNAYFARINEVRREMKELIRLAAAGAGPLSTHRA